VSLFNLLFLFFLSTRHFRRGQAPYLRIRKALRIDSPPNMRDFFPHTPLQCAVLCFQMYIGCWNQHTGVVSLFNLLFLFFLSTRHFRRGQAPCLRIRRTLRTHSPPNMRDFFPHPPLQCAVLCFQMYLRLLETAHWCRVSFQSFFMPPRRILHHRCFCVKTTVEIYSNTDIFIYFRYQKNLYILYEFYKYLHTLLRILDKKHIIIYYNKRQLLPCLIFFTKQGIY